MTGPARKEPPFTAREDAIIRELRASADPTPWHAIADRLGRNRTRVRERGKALAEADAAETVEREVVANAGAPKPHDAVATLRGREPKPCTVPLRTLVMRQRATGIRT